MKFARLTAVNGEAVYVGNDMIIRAPVNDEYADRAQSVIANLPIAVQESPEEVIEIMEAAFSERKVRRKNR